METKAKKDGMLLDVLVTSFQELSHKKIKSYLKSGCIFVNGIGTTKYNKEVKKGDILSIRRENKSHKRSPLKILYEDDDFLVIDKPSGLLSIATEKEKEKTAYHMMREFIRKRGKKEKIFLLHRLDKDTSGVLIFVKDEKLKGLLQNDWNQLVKVREYRAVVKGKVTPLQNYVCYLEERGEYSVCVSKNHQGRKAITSFNVIKENKKYSLLNVWIKTGRKNQIRVVLSHLSYPIVGDKKYGDPKEKSSRLYLHASKISLLHPVNKKNYTFESKMPSSFFLLMK